MADEKKRIGRKLLIASLGVASVSYGACGGRSPLSSDAAADRTRSDAGVESGDAATPGADAAEGGANDDADASPDRQFTGNLIP
jgi:hypothetical protein